MVATRRTSYSSHKRCSRNRQPAEMKIVGQGTQTVLQSNSTAPESKQENEAIAHENEAAIEDDAAAPKLTAAPEAAPEAPAADKDDSEAAAAAANNDDNEAAPEATHIAGANNDDNEAGARMAGSDNEESEAAPEAAHVAGANNHDNEESEAAHVAGANNDDNGAAPEAGAGSDEGVAAAASKNQSKLLAREEQLEMRKKCILYFRHRLQKGFLSGGQAPKEEDMANMSAHLKQLEAYKDLEEEVIKYTKVNKVLKGIIKLQSIPREEQFRFKKRSIDLLNTWNRALAAQVQIPDGPTSAQTKVAIKIGDTRGNPIDIDAIMTLGETKENPIDVDTYCIEAPHFHKRTLKRKRVSNHERRCVRWRSPLVPVI